MSEINKVLSSKMFVRFALRDALVMMRLVEHESLFTASTGNGLFVSRDEADHDFSDLTMAQRLHSYDDGSYSGSELTCHEPEIGF